MQKNLNGKEDVNYMILTKRIPRDLKQNFFRNFAMFVIIAMVTALITAMCLSADDIEYTIYKEWARCNLEDGSFETYTPLSARNFKELEELDVMIERMFYSDVPAEGERLLRIFALRCRINLPNVDEGFLPEKDNEIFIDKIFAKNQGLKLGDEVVLNGTPFYITAIGTLPDYSYILQNDGDVSANDDFGIAAVTYSDFTRMTEGVKTVYHYAYILGNCTQRELKDKLAKLDFDYNAVKDTYIRAETQRDLKRSFAENIGALKRGSNMLAFEIENFGKTLGKNGIEADTAPFYDGALAISSGLDTLYESFSDYLSGNGKIQNISFFGEAKDSTRINDALDDSRISKQSALVIGVIMFALLIYMLAIFASESIDREHMVIGTLYSLGCNKREICFHYMAIPALITVSAVIFGAVCGFFLSDMLVETYSAMYSFARLEHIYPMYLILYLIIMPVMLTVLINGFVLYKRLNLMPLEMMRGSKKANIKKFNIKGGDRLSFAAKFKIRQFIRELRGNITLFCGIVMSILLMMFSVACYSSIDGYIKSVADDVKAQYTYILRNPVSDLPKNSVIGYMRSFQMDFKITGGEMSVNLLGIDRDNPYFDFAPYLSDEADKVYMSDSVRIKFGIKKGDKAVFKDAAEDTLYAFEVADEVKYGNGLYFFMNIDAMREAFGQPYISIDDLKKGERVPKSENYYYNTVFSDTPVRFRHNMMLTEIKRESLVSGAEKFMTLMWGMIVMMIVISVVIFVAVMYLLMKLEIDRSAFAVSLMKAIGFDEKTVNSLYLSNSLYMVIFALIFGMPLCKLVVDFIYPYCVSNVNGAITCNMNASHYVVVVLTVAVSYALTYFCLTRYLRKIKLTEILKNRE